jgi:hypothetical protein
MADERRKLRDFLYGNEELEQLEEIVDEFNIFTALDIVDKERRHSNFLAWLLDPSESHGLGDYFLKLFLQKMAMESSEIELVDSPSIFDIEHWSYEDVQIEREWKYIDILIRDDENKFVCVIENKIYSEEHSDQLQRYRETTENKFKDYEKLFVFLTVEETKPSDDMYIPVSYRFIAEIVEKLEKNKKDKVSEEILNFISDYRKMLRRYIMEESEIQEICRKIYAKHSDALDLIYKYMPDKRTQLYEITKNIIENDPDFILDYHSKTWICCITKNLDFIPKEGDEYDSGRILLFMFENCERKLDFGLHIHPGPQHIRKKIYEIAQKNTKLFNKANRKLTDYYFVIFKKTFVNEKDYDKDLDEIKDQIRRKLEYFKKHELPQIVKEMKKFEEGS